MVPSSGGRLPGRPAGRALHQPEECAISLFPHDWGRHPVCKGMLLINRDGLDVDLPLLDAAVNELRNARFSPHWPKVSASPS